MRHRRKSSKTRVPSKFRLARKFALVQSQHLTRAVAKQQGALENYSGLQCSVNTGTKSQSNRDTKQGIDQDITGNFDAISFDEQTTLLYRAFSDARQSAIRSFVELAEQAK